MRAGADVLAAKLFRPPPRPGWVARPRLTARLDALRQPGRRLAVLLAPAGYGKTTLLSAWLQAAPAPVAWLSLDADDNDPARWLAHLTAALAAVCPAVGAPPVTWRPGAPQPQVLHAALTGLVNGLAAPANGNGPHPDSPAVPALLALDDLHLLTSPALHAALEFLIDHLPPAWRVVLTSRSEPPLPLARWRARGELLELGPADLSFTPPEAANLLNESLGLALDPATVADLARRTEGWAAGLQLAALVVQAAPSPVAASEAVSGRHRFVADYLVQEVLERQPAPVRDFLLRTSILERLEAGLCAALLEATPASGAAALLDQLDRAGLFLIPLDDERRWYRYHHLFVEALQAQLQRTQPALVVELHHRAGAWFAAHDALPEAIAHALAARDYPQAVRLLDPACDRLIRLGRLETIRGWLAALPTELVLGDPALCVWQCWTLLDAGQVAALDPYLQSAERHLACAAAQPAAAPPLSSPEYRAQLAGQIAVIRTQRALQTDEPEAALRYAQAALRALQPNQLSLRSYVALNLSHLHLCREEVAAADELLTEAHATLRQVYHPFVQLQVAEALIGLRVMQGRLRAALAVGDDALALAAALHLAPQALAVHERLAYVRLERHELDAAERHAIQAEALARQSGEAVVLAQADLLWARLEQARGAQSAAEQRVAAVADRLGLNPAQGLPPWFGAWQARFWLAAGQPVRARAALGARPLGPVQRETEQLHFTQARLWLAEQRPADALKVIRSLRAATEAAGRWGLALRCRVSQALAHQALGQRAQALQVLARALELAAPEGYARVFLDEGAPLLALLGQLAVTHPQRPYADYVLTLAGVTLEAAPVRFVPDRPDPPAALTAREREILGLLAAGLTNQQIAARLVMAIGTVRWYSKQIYRKLDVHNRTQAVLCAQALGLV